MRGDRAVLSVDLELLTHTPAYRSATGGVDGPTVGLDGVDHLLAAFDERGIKTTFFVVSEIADTHLGTVKDIANAGHEIASHTHSHARLSTLDAGERKAELEISRETLEMVADVEVQGFRAPVFDLAPDHFAAVDRAGYAYDSSVIPSRRIPGFYGGGHNTVRPGPVDRITPGAPENLWELPVAVMPGIRLPLSGAWLRFFGLRYTILGMRMLANRGITPILYVHPWELVDLPRISGLPRRVSVRTGGWMRRAIGTILDEPFRFTTAAMVARG